MLKLVSTLKSFLNIFRKQSVNNPAEETTPPPKNFCASPWVTAVLFADGRVVPCSNSGYILGNWHEESLIDLWHGARYREFRKKIAAGEFPNNDCKVCFSGDSIYTKFHTYLHSPFNYYYRDLVSILGREIPELSSIGIMMSKDYDSSSKYLANSLQKIQEIKDTDEFQRDGIPTLLDKIEKIAITLKSYHESCNLPPIIVPYRAVQILTKCNAKCIHCLDVVAEEQKRVKTLDPKHIDNAFSESEDIIGFFHHGSELLLYKDWDKILSILSGSGVKTSISTNGMLLTNNRMRDILNGNFVRAINISFDGAKKETVESIQVNVNFDKKVTNVTNLFEYAEEKNIKLTISLSFVVAKYNYKELPEFVRLIEKMRGKSTSIPCNLVIYSLLVSTSSEQYSAFLQENHISNVPENDFSDVLEQTLAETKRIGIGSIFNGCSLEEFITNHGQIPHL